MSTVTIGGDRLGSGKRMKANLDNYQRSTHDLSYVWRSTMAAGTLVPFMTQLALPGDTFDIELNCDIMTHPTIGPLFGTYKVQLDIFQVPFRLYQADLHMNKLGIGRDMSQIVLPQIIMNAAPLDMTKPVDNQQINPSCIFSYLGIRGLGVLSSSATEEPTRAFNAIPYLAYWDIYKNYYSNKQEEIGAVIHKDIRTQAVTIMGATVTGIGTDYNFTIPYQTPQPDPIVYTPGKLQEFSTITLGGAWPADTDPSQLVFWVKRFTGLPQEETLLLFGTDIWENWQVLPSVMGLYGSNPIMTGVGSEIDGWGFVAYYGEPVFQNTNSPPSVKTFLLENIDQMRSNILRHVPQPGKPFVINSASIEPYGLPMTEHPTTESLYAQVFALEGLALKTYQSDLFNNWISTEWIDGTDGISAITAIDTTDGSFTLDELNLSQKVYDMLNRIAISGGSYDDWLDAVYTHERQRSAENPMYLGGLIKQLVFQEVTATAATSDTPLGSLAGKGVMGGKHKGGKVVAKVDEPSYIIGIVSLTPNVDYSQGNNWDMNLRTMNDLHKPALDQIGFQDLITDQLAWWETRLGDYTAGEIPQTVFRSAGKQPAWTNYMTNVNKCYGNFADQGQQMWMTLNRRYEFGFDPTGGAKIGDLTTYVDPNKYNHIFADTRRDAQNFWTQIHCQITARRKMSAKIMPNL